MEFSRSFLTGDFGTLRDVDLKALLVDFIKYRGIPGVVSPVVIFTNTSGVSMLVTTTDCTFHSGVCARISYKSKKSKRI